jgi:hypothetical protein
MRLALPWLALAACSFEHGQLGATDDDASVEADSGTDAAIDGSPLVDSDGDTVFDDTDNCIAKPNLDQRDFDQDKHGDACDRCPHLASTPDPDGDGDGVGDACDPRPSTAGDLQALWLGFYDAADIAGWYDGNTGGAGTWSVTGGALTQSAANPNNFASWASPGTYQHVYVATQFEVGTPQTGATVGMCSGWDGSSFDCCNVNERGASPVAQAQTGTAMLIDSAWTPGLTAGEVIDVLQDLSSGLNVCTFKTTSGTSVTQVTSTSQAAQITARILFYAGHTTAKYRYVFVVAIGS